MNNKALFNISYGLYILTAKQGEKDNGCIINTFMQLTSSPLSVSIAVNKDNYTTQMIKETGEFNITVLTEDTSFDTFKRFGFASGKNTDKFEGLTPERSANGIAYLDGNSYFFCKVKEAVDCGTHLIFVADVLEMEVLNSRPSATYDYYHKNIKPKPQEKKKGFRCTICNYVLEADTLPEDFICPICKHGAEAFVPL